MATSPSYDVFVSYAAADRAWVEGYLLDALSAAGIKVHSEAAFDLGQPRLLAFEQAVIRSRRTLLVISPAYVADESTGFVDLLAQTFGLDTATWPVIPLVLKPVAMPPRLSLLTRLEATDPSDWATAVERLVTDLDHEDVPPADKPECPYPGMRPFAEEDASVFHGRDLQTDELLRRLHAQRNRTHRFQAVIGPSGSGKSSLVFAGLIPALRRSTIFGPDVWTVLSLRPGPAPMKTQTVILGDTPTAGRSLAELVEAPPSTPWLLIVDQFEELFTIAAPEQVRRFETALAEFAAMPDCYVVLTARADFYEDLMASDLWPLIRLNRVEVLPLDEAGLRSAIVTPAERSGVYVEGALVERLVGDAAGEPGVLPLVQQTLVLLWDRLERRFLPLSAYEALVLPRSAYDATEGGTRTGLQVAVAHHADATMAELTPERQAIARRVFIALVQPNEGRADTRRQRSVAELRSAGDAPARFDEVVEHLARNRLLTLSGEDISGAPRVDLAHETLIDGWPWLRELVSLHRDAAQVKQRLDDKVAEWDRLGRGRGGLLDVVELAEAEQWLASPNADLLGYGHALPALLAASRTEQAREVRRLRIRLYGAVAFAAVALVAAIIALTFFRRAEAESTRARENEELAQAAATQAVDSATTADAERNNAEEQAAAAATAQVLAEDNADRYQQEADARATEVIVRGLAEERAETEAAAASAAEASALQAQSTAEFQAQVSRSQALAAQAPNQHDLGDDERAGLLAVEAYRHDLASGNSALGQVDQSLRTILAQDYFSVILRGHRTSVSSVAFSPDGSTLATGSHDSTARLWNQDDPTADPVVLEGHGGGVTSVAFSPDGSTLATGSRDTTVRLWNLDDLTADPVVLRSHEGAVEAVAFSPDGQILATGGNDGLVQLHGLDGSPAEPVVLHGHEGWVTSLAFNPDGATLATGSRDTTVRLWNLEDPTAEPVVLDDHEGVVNAVAFSPGGSLLATGGLDSAVRLWDLNDPEASPALFDHAPATGAVAFSPDGSILATGGTDSTVRLWNLDDAEANPAVLRGHEVGVTSIAFSPDGQTLATGGATTAVSLTADPSTVRLWNLDAPLAAPVDVRGLEGVVEAVAFSLDGSSLATGTGGLDSTFRIWDVNTPTAAPVNLDHEVSISDIALSPDGSTLATGGWDGMVRIWNLDDPTADPVVLRGHDAFVESVAFSPDGMMLASGGVDQTARLWNLNRPEVEPVVLPHNAAVDAVAFSGDGQALVTGDHDGTLSVWDTDDPTSAPVIVPGHEGRIWDISFSPTGTTFASGSGDGTARIWNLDQLEADPITLRGHEEWVTSVDFNADGSTLATGSYDATVRLWDLDRLELDPVILRGHEASVSAIAFSPDGSTLATGRTDGTVQLWIAETDVLAELMCQQVRRNLSVAEWQQFVGQDVPYRTTCPGLPPGEGAPSPTVVGTPVTVPPGGSRGHMFPSTPVDTEDP